jgi:hypothetical protein
MLLCERRMLRIVKIEHILKIEPRWTFSCTVAYIVTIYMCVTDRRGMDWILNLLITCIHHSELHVTDHWHTQIVSSVCLSPLAVYWQRLLPREILRHPALRSSCHSRPRRTPVNWQLNNLDPRLVAVSHQPTYYSSLHGPTFNWTLWLTNQLLHVTLLHWTADNWVWNSSDPAYNISTRTT